MTLSLPTPRTPDPMTAPALRWGVMGPGGIASGFTDALHTHTRSRVVAVGSRSPTSGDDGGSRSGVDRTGCRPWAGATLFHAIIGAIS